MSFKLAANQLAHIDNGFYFLTPKQARALSITGKTPRPGWQTKADPEKLKQFVFGKIELYPTATKPDNRRFKAFENVLGENSIGWIQQTPLSWFNGADVKEKQVWAIYIQVKEINQKGINLCIS